MIAHIDEGGAPHTARWEIALVAAVVVLAALLRVWRIGDLPPGLHVDEAFNILDAREVIGGARPVFLLENAGRDVLYTYLQAPLLAWLGTSPAVARLASAIAGTLTVLVVWGFVRTLPLPRPRLVALLTAAYMAFSYWHLHFSRFGIRAVLFPLVVTGAMWAWWRIAGDRGPTASVRGESAGKSGEAAGDRGKSAADQGEAAGEPGELVGDPGQSAGDRGKSAGRRGWSWLDVAVLGALLGLAFYTHPVGRALWLVPLVHALYRWLRARDARPLRALGPALLLSGLLALPLITFWSSNPGSFSGHASEVSVLDGGPIAVASNAGAVAGMFNIAGDPAPWRNLKERPQLYRALAAAGIDRDDPVALSLRGRPVFDPLTGLLFLAGLALAAAAAWRGADWAALVLIWLLMLLAPSVLTDAAPNYSRAIGALPVVCLMPALAVDRLAAAARGRWGVGAAATVVVAALAVHALGTSYDYFVVWARHEDTPSAFDADKVALARYADLREADGAFVYLSDVMADHPTVKVSSAGRPRGFDPEFGFVYPSIPGTSAAYVYLASEGDARDDIQRLISQPAEELVFDGHNLAVAELQGGHGLTDAAPPADENASPVFGGRIRLAGWEVPAGALVPGTTSWVTLVWEAVEPIDDDLTTALQIVAKDGAGIAYGDALPIGGTYPTQMWRPDELVASIHQVTVADDAETGTARLLTGWYHLLEDAPLVPLLTADGGAIVAIDEIPVGP